MKKVILIVCLMLIALLTSCHIFTDNPVFLPIGSVPSKKINVASNNAEYQKIIKQLIYMKVLHPKWGIKELKAEIQYQKYLSEK